MQGREYQVSGERGADGDVGGFAVADLADQDEVWVLSEHAPQHLRETQPKLGAYLDLDCARQFAFNRIFDRHGAQARPHHRTHECGQGGRLAGTRWAGHNDDAMRGRRGLGESVEGRGRQPEFGQHGRSGFRLEQAE